MGTTTKLLPPAEYFPALRRLRERNRYARSWIMRLERMTNRHPETWGGAWGWYEVWPLGIEVGFWSDRGRDDLAGVDIGAWNAEAEALSAPTPDGEREHG